MTVTANTVLIAQENPGINRSRILRVESSDPQFSAFKAGTTLEDMLYFFVRQMKNGAVTPLRSDRSLDEHRVQFFDLFFLTWEQA